MNAGKIASLTLVALLAAIAAGIWGGLELVPKLAGLAPPARLGIAVGATAAIAAGVLLPLGVVADRALARFRRYVESIESSESVAVYRGPAWLAPVMRAAVAAIEGSREREQSLRSELRTVEVRRHVAEAGRRQIEAVLHALRDPVLVTDPFNEIVMANEAAARVLAFDLEEAIHRPIDAVVADARLCQLVHDMKETGNVSERRHVEHELPMPGDAQRKAVFDVTLACVENHRREPGGVVAILHDLTREREISEMKTEFVSQASHELRTPLSTIRAYLEMLVDGEAEDAEVKAEAYRVMSNETERLGRMIDNMLNISRIEAGIVQIQRENVDVKAIIERTVRSLEPQARERSISLNTRLSDVDLRVEGEADMLYQVVLNLVSNAVKYTPEGGRITLCGDTDNLTRSVVVSVSDTGLGIPPDDVPRLFDKFYRVKSYERVAKGTGLGLNLCKHIIETVHHGQIGVESKLGMGSKFWFSVPMRYVGSQAAA